VKVLPGEKSTSFTIRTTPVVTSETGFVRATVRNMTVSQQLTVRPIGVSTLTVTPTWVAETRSALGTVTLECAAAPGPITVNVGSEDPAVAHPVPTSVVVPQGLQSATFDIATNLVDMSTSVPITATANGILKSTTLLVIRRRLQP
jgi:hypothetical protein